MSKEGVKINCNNCPMQSWCERVDKDYTCKELLAIYERSLDRARKAALGMHVTFGNLYMINADWGTNTPLYIRLGRAPGATYIEMSAHKAAETYGNWIVEGYRRNEVILCRGD